MQSVPVLPKLATALPLITKRAQHPKNNQKEVNRLADEREKDGPMPEIEMVTVEEPPKPRELYHIASRVLDIPRMERVYKLQRAVVNLKAPLAAPL